MKILEVIAKVDGCVKLFSPFSFHIIDEQGACPCLFCVHLIFVHFCGSYFTIGITFTYRNRLCKIVHFVKLCLRK